MSRHDAVAFFKVFYWTTQLRALGKTGEGILLFSFAGFIYQSHRGICYRFYHPVFLPYLCLAWPRIFDNSKPRWPPRHLDVLK